MKQIVFLSFLFFFFSTTPAEAANHAQLTTYTTTTLQIITTIASLTSVFFLIKGGYEYILSTGRPEALQQAKKTIRYAILGLMLVLTASVIVSVFQQALTPSSSSTPTAAVELTPIVPSTPSNGLTQVLIDAFVGLMQYVVESGTKPIMDAVFGFLLTTPTLQNNSVIVNFWVLILGITDVLFVLVVALLGLHVMSAQTFGFEEVEIKQLLPRIGLGFLGAHVSLFLADYVIITCNVLVTTVLDATGGLNHAWVTHALSLDTLLTPNKTALITLIFLFMFLIVSIVLLLMYITRLIAIAVAAVLSPLLFLLWVLPKFSDIAEIAMKSYVVTVFTVFVHVVIIQLAASFITIPGNTNNPLLSIIVGIGLFCTLLKTPALLMQLVLYNSGRVLLQTISGHMVNVMASNTSSPKQSTGKRYGESFSAIEAMRHYRNTHAV